MRGGIPFNCNAYSQIVLKAIKQRRIDESSQQQVNVYNEGDMTAFNAIIFNLDSSENAKRIRRHTWEHAHNDNTVQINVDDFRSRRTNYK